MHGNALLAFGLQDLIPIAILLFSFISWIVKTVKSQPRGLDSEVGKPPPPRRPLVDNATERLNREIDSFLQQVSPQQASRTADENIFEASSSAQQPRKPVSQGSSKNSGKKKAKRSGKRGLPPAEEQLSHAMGTRRSLVEREGKSDFEGVKRHVSQHLDSHPLAKQVERDLEDRVQESVEQHLGRAGGQRPGASPLLTEIANPQPAAPSLAPSLLHLLREPEHVRQAMVVNEILSRPVALRPR